MCSSLASGVRVPVPPSRPLITAHRSPFLRRRLRVAGQQLSSAELYLGGGTKVQKAVGYDDSADDVYGYLMDSNGPRQTLKRFAPMLMAALIISIG